MYRILLAVHLIAVISWMAGILYLLRLFVYHAMETEAVVKERFQLMERRLYKVITTPAMVVAFVFGFWMLHLNPTIVREPWMHAKLLFVALLIGVTHYAKRVMRQLAADQCRLSPTQLRILNEVPTVLMVLIVVMVIVRPF